MIRQIYSICCNRTTGEIIYQSRATYDLGSDYSRKKLHKQLEAALRRMERMAPRDCIELTIRTDSDDVQPLLPFV